MNRRLLVVVVLALFPFTAKANCLPPWQTLFACDIARSSARAEFCEIADPESHKSLKSHYYTYVVGTKPAELYFEADGYYFSTKDTVVDHPTDLTMGVGLTNKNYVYSFFVTEDKKLDGKIREAEVRVYKSLDAFSNETRDNEQLRLQCDPGSIIANHENIRP
ncbi:hypothetical protein [Agrobacterium tumefaciens]|uniref:hypothetical protein n=1 Tax=Agrobacterium tumefaciens TaxID=358 RepID=UPI00287C4C5F|nr:hypothetical protein [Agrobacterium tumefaciens]MDS7594336.1 hypothetical protein [Agrobacterium tumefaciens]